MDIAELFTRGVTSLPGAAKQRLDGDAPLDWAALSRPGAGIDVADAARNHRRLRPAVETLVERLIAEVGIVPADVLAGAEREGTASAWLRHVAIEPDGESYRLRNDLNGETCAGIRPEAIAGYATLALDLATAVHEAAELWIEVGNRYGPVSGDGSSLLARCAIRMSARIGAPSEPGSGPRAIGNLAEALEDAWNSQSLTDRAELSTAIRLSTARGAAAPRQCHFAPMNGYRMHACDPAELRWLRALAERAMRGAPAHDPENRSPEAEWAGDVPAADADETLVREIGALAARADPEAGTTSETLPEPDADELALGRQLADLRREADRLPAGSREKAATVADPAGRASEEAASLDMTALEAQIRAETMNAFELGSDPGELSLDEQLAKIQRAAKRLPGPVRKRFAETYGVGVVQAFARLQDAGETDALYAELRGAAAGRHVPRWLEDLAGALLADAGASTGGGLRTGSLRLDPEDGAQGRYLVTELETGAHGSLTLRGLLEQIHLGLAFAHGAWAGLAILQNAGKEGGWTLSENLGENARLAGNERDTLEAANQIGRALERIHDAYAHPRRPPSALEQASMAADALTTVGPTVRVAAGWPGAIGPPDPRNPEDVARVAEVAESLHGDIKSISNRLIAGRMAASGTYAERQEA